ncbi:MAG: hypothetical protein U0165_03030 [Polyangiaceae bacterium]
MAEPRRLPVLQSSKPAPGAAQAPSSDEPEPRPAWHWSAIGALLIFSMMLPLSMLAAGVTGSFLTSIVPAGSPEQVQEFLNHADSNTLWKIRLAQVTPGAIAFVMAATAGGALVGRFGGDARTKEATVAGLIAATVAWSLAAITAGFASTWMVWPALAGIGSLSAFVGGRWGLSKRSAA